MTEKTNPDSEIELADLLAYRASGSWPSGRPPRWASELAAALGTRVGSARFDRELEARYIVQLEAALRPFAEAGAALDPHRNGKLLDVTSSDGKAAIVTDRHLRTAARTLGLEPRRPRDKVQVLDRSELVDRSTLWQIRRQGAYRDSPSWLLLRERREQDGTRILEALAYSGKVTRATHFSADDEPRPRLFSRDAVEIQDPGRRTAVASLAGAGLRTGRALKEAFDRITETDRRERIRRRRWKLAADIHLTREGVPHDRLVRLTWLDAPAGQPSDAVLLVTADGKAKRVADVPRPAPGAPRWQFWPFPREAADKLLAGIAAEGDRLIAEGLETLDSDLDLLSAAAADAAWTDLSQC
ncbi:hypothetical protein SAMN06265365_11087 [Tistlia consotensis]|uniref:Uncharacterized protein n=1 Tax=Tistlia consotensis USBA 355 TaxID=560819 RepID=A0A1Y6C095_9PROT|nr:hypothetical protein [Tistlia consotensis]SMF27241.1 hypothetical protein SAMN05428998_10969 [Tistlia consotensis USBA 355]SNR66331.1 hypothetical protein SAMN06265365_11087 [Tistlia consotensis]